MRDKFAKSLGEPLAHVVKRHERAESRQSDSG